jgi:hypothetical protein
MIANFPRVISNRLRIEAVLNRFQGAAAVMQQLLLGSNS